MQRISNLEGATVCLRKFKSWLRCSRNLAVLGLLLSACTAFADQLNIMGPPGSGGFGWYITPLPNGNIVVKDPYFDLSNPTVIDVGAVYLYAPDGVMISRLTGSSANDQVGLGGVTVLSNGNFVVNSYLWHARSAITWGSANLGVSGTVSSANSLLGRGGATHVTALNNGHYVVRDPLWRNGDVEEAGAVTWGDGVNGTVGEVSAANSLVGSRYFDRIGDDRLGTGDGSGITLLTNGNFVVRSWVWADNFGAVTWANGTGGSVGVVSAANSLVGTTAMDQVGNGGIIALSNGNYVVSSINWDKPGANSIFDAGAVTWGRGTTGVSGVISAANSLIGSSQSDQIGTDYWLQSENMITALSNGNYVVISVNWDAVNPAVGNVGAVTWGNGAVGITGEISASNSYIGATQSDHVGAFFGPGGPVNTGITELSNGNYVFASIFWQLNGKSVGAVTWGNGATGSAGKISSANSLVGSNNGDTIGANGITALANGNYVVASSGWDALARGVEDVGAVTWGNGATGSAGIVSPDNSLVGSQAFDRVGNRVTPLSNSNYVVVSPAWSSSAPVMLNVGAVTWGNGTGGTVGAVSARNSLIGGSADDAVGGYREVVALTNGNYVVPSESWDGAAPRQIDVGAATWGNGLGGTTGKVSAANSVTGSTANDQVGYIVALSNGNYVMASGNWDSATAVDAGAVAWGDGVSGTTGLLSPANSLVGSSTNDFVGDVHALGNGNYVVASQGWDGTAIDVGAVTLGNGHGGTVGVISSSNSLIGSAAYDAVGFVRQLNDDSYAVASYQWDNALIVNAGAVSLGGISGVKGPINASNSVVGTQMNVGGSLRYAYDTTRKHLIVGRPAANTITIFGDQVRLLFSNGFE